MRVLLAVAEHGGIAAAARALSFTPPAVSQQIAALERQLDVELIDRSQRMARLTLAGHRLAGHARQVLAGLEAAEADLASLDGPIHGVLRIGTIPTLGRTLLPATLAHLGASAPELDLRIEQIESEESLPALARGELDVAMAGEYDLTPGRRHTSVERLNLFTEPVFVAVPANYPLPGPHVRLEDLRDARWIAPAPGTSCAVLLERSCAIAGYEPGVVGHCADFALAADIVAAGHGIALIPSIAAPTNDSPSVRLLTAEDPSIHRTLYAAIRHGTRRHPATASLIEALTVAAKHFTAGGPAAEHAI